MQNATLHAFPRIARPAHRRLVLGGLATVFALAACGGGGEDGPSNSFTAIANTADAKFVAGVLADTAANLVPSGTYANKTVNGQRGSARVSGSKTHSGAVSCGSSCVRRTNSADLTIVFNDYYARPTPAHTNTFVRINGTLTFTDTTSSRQQGLSYSSSGRMTVSGSSLNVRVEMTSGAGEFGYADTVTTLSTASSTSTAWPDGSLQASNGVTYSW